MSLPRQILCLSAALAAAALPLSSAFAAKPHRRAVLQAPAPVALSPVDVSHLRQIGLGDMADRLQSRLTADLQAAGVNGRVVVRLTGLSLSPFSGNDGGGGGSSGSGSSGGNFDYLDGEVLTVGPRGEVLASRPQLVSLPSSSGGAYYLPGFDDRRIEALSKAYAAWVVRSL